MSAGPDRTAAARGFTLIELIVVISLIAIMLAIAAPNFVAFQRNSQLTSTANSFIAALSAARAEAMKRNHNALVVPAANGVPTNGTDWTVGWVVFVDMSSPPNNTYEAGTDVMVMQQEGLPSTITTPTTSGSTRFIDGSAAYALFNGSGFPRRGGGAFAPLQSLDFAIGSATAAASMRRVNTSSTGRMWVCKPGTGGDPGC